MDEAVKSAITAVGIDNSATQQQWFDVICETYDGLAQSGQPDWDTFTSSLTEKAGSDGLGQIAEQFIQRLGYADPAPIETIGRMRDLSAQLPELYRELSAGTSGGSTSGGDGSGANGAAADGAPAATGYDESAWFAFLARNGPRWDGEAGSWEQFKAWFLYEAEQGGLAAPARGFIGYAESQPDRVAVFAAYGVQIQAAAAREGEHQQPEPDLSAYPELKSGDSGEWVAYLDAMLTSNGF